jgi:hypothetical protein
LIQRFFLFICFYTSEHFIHPIPEPAVPKSKRLQHRFQQDGVKEMAFKPILRLCVTLRYVVCLIEALEFFRRNVTELDIVLRDVLESLRLERRFVVGVVGVYVGTRRNLHGERRPPRSQETEQRGTQQYASRMCGRLLRRGSLFLERTEQQDSTQQSLFGSA